MRIGSILGILGLLLLVDLAEAWTPGLKITPRNESTVRWGWNNATTNRMQDNYTCSANERCTGIVNVTVSAYLWAGPRDVTRGSYRPTFALHTDHGQINVTAKVTVVCCKKKHEIFSIYHLLKKTKNIKIAQAMLLGVGRLI